MKGIAYVEDYRKNIHTTTVLIGLTAIDVKKFDKNLIFFDVNIRLAIISSD